MLQRKLDVCLVTEVVECPVFGFFVFILEEEEAPNTVLLQHSALEPDTGRHYPTSEEAILFCIALTVSHGYSPSAWHRIQQNACNRQRPSPAVQEVCSLIPRNLTSGSLQMRRDL